MDNVGIAYEWGKLVGQLEPHWEVIKRYLGIPYNQYQDVTMHGLREMLKIVAAQAERFAQIQAPLKKPPFHERFQVAGILIGVLNRKKDDNGQAE